MARRADADEAPAHVIVLGDGLPFEIGSAPLPTQPCADVIRLDAVNVVQRQGVGWFASVNGGGQGPRYVAFEDIHRYSAPARLTPCPISRMCGHPFCAVMEHIGWHLDCGMAEFTRHGICYWKPCGLMDCPQRETLTMELTMFSELVGCTLTAVHVEETESDRVVFTLNDGSVYQLHHDQDCCESVTVHDVAGNITDLLGTSILFAEESSSDDRPADVPSREDTFDNSETWTFYRIGTIRGSVVIRWIGRSNGYYSERVSFTKMKGR